MNKRTINEVLNVETGEEISADTFFKKANADIFDFRYRLEEAIKGHKPPLFQCYYCKQLIKINGAKGADLIAKGRKSFHFAHLKSSNDCPIKSTNNLTKAEVLRIKYNGAKESLLHHTLKHKLAEYLELNQSQGLGIESVDIEKRVVSEVTPKEYKRPDVQSVYKGVNLVFELQLSTTFLSVIEDRQHFYQQNQAHIIWVFHKLALDEDRRRFTENDVIFSNKNNAFVFDEDAQNQSKQQNRLILKCIYQKNTRYGNQILSEWQECFVSLEDLTFEHDSCVVY